MMDLNFMAKVLGTWCVRTFGVKYAERQERALRLVEEAVELAQAEELTESQLMKLVTAVYARPLGSTYKEAGGVFVTLMCYMWAVHPGAVHACFMSEVSRILDTDPSVFQRRNAEKVHQGLSV